MKSLVIWWADLVARPINPSWATTSNRQNRRINAAGSRSFLLFSFLPSPAAPKSDHYHLGFRRHGKSLPFLSDHRSQSLRHSPPIPESPVFFSSKFHDTLAEFFRAGIALQPQGDYIELHQKRHGRRLDYDERKRKREAREVHTRSKQAQKVGGAGLSLIFC
jgi:hypothetical protein